MKPVRKSVLLKTSSASDVQNSGGYLAITGLLPVSKNDIVSIKQVKYRAEVNQVVTISLGTDAPTASTKYAIEIFDTQRKSMGWTETPKVYSYVTPAVLTGTAAEQREVIFADLVAKINNDSTNHGTAVSLGSGTGMTFTDDGGYYPFMNQSGSNVKGPNAVVAKTMSTGYGFTQSNITVTTAAVISSGEGAKLISQVPVVDNVFNNLISGDIYEYPLTTTGETAVSGQKYDAFSISSLKIANIPTVSDHYGYVDCNQTVWVDNGTGGSTSNRTGFLTFEGAMAREIAQTYEKDKNATIDFFDKPTIFQGAAGAVPTTTGTNKVDGGYGQYNYALIGTNTITVPTPTNSGLLIDHDLTDTEGAEHMPSLLTINSESFIVGAQEFSHTERLTVADHTDAGFMIGFRKKAAHVTDFNDYTDLGAIGFLGDLIYTWGILNNAATVATNTTIVPVDAAQDEFIVKVDKTGLVSVFYQGVKYPVYSAGTTPLTFDAGDEMIWFVRSVNISGGDPDVTLNQRLVLPSADWIS